MIMTNYRLCEVDPPDLLMSHKFDEKKHPTTISKIGHSCQKLTNQRQSRYAAYPVREVHHGYKCRVVYSTDTTLCSHGQPPSHHKYWSFLTTNDTKIMLRDVDMANSSESVLVSQRERNQRTILRKRRILSDDLVNFLDVWFDFIHVDMWMCCYSGKGSS